MIHALVVVSFVCATVTSSAAIGAQSARRLHVGAMSFVAPVGWTDEPPQSGLYKLALKAPDGAAGITVADESLGSASTSQYTANYVAGFENAARQTDPAATFQTSTTELPAGKAYEVIGHLHVNDAGKRVPFTSPTPASSSRTAKRTKWTSRFFPPPAAFSVSSRRNCARSDSGTNGTLNPDAYRSR